MWLLTTFTYPETYAPVLLNKRAAALSKRTGKVYISYMEMGKPPKTIGQQFAVGLSRPWILLFKEPIVLLTSIYMAIIYGTLYLCFAAFPIVFQVGRGWGPGTGGLAFLGLAVGMVFAVSGNIFDNKRYVRISNEHGGMAPPEARLPPAIVGSFLIPVGMFMFAWTNGPEIHWIVPIIGSAIFGGGIVLVFMSLLTYLIETYVIFAASVLAANSVLRSLFGMAFPLFTTYMYEDLGIHWASSIPAFLAIACLPFPILFYKYGNTIRMKCFYASEAAAVVEKMRAQHAAVITEDEAMEEVTRKITAASRASRA